MTQLTHETITPHSDEKTTQAGKTKTKYWLEVGALPALWIIEIVAFAIFGPTSFLSPGNFADIFNNGAVLFIVALALIVPMTAGDYDLSVGAVASLGATVVGVLSAQHHVPVVFSLVVALVAGALIGAVNACFVVLLNIDPFIVTLGTGTAVTGLVYAMTGEATIVGIPTSLTKWVSGIRLGSLSLDFFYAVAAAIILWWLLSYTHIGVRLLYVGQSRSVARLTGVPIGRLRWGALMFSALLSALAGVIYAGVLGAADPSSGSTAFLLPAFAAAFLGSTTVKPGRFNPFGTGIAIYFLATGVTGLELAGFQTYVQDLFYGIALVGAVATTMLLRRSSEQSYR